MLDPLRTAAGEDQRTLKTEEPVYLVRNETPAPLAIASFETGVRFEPDFLLFLR